jgi:hypothetical protein
MNSSVVKKRQLPAVKDERSRFHQPASFSGFWVYAILMHRKKVPDGRGGLINRMPVMPDRRTGEFCETVKCLNTEAVCCSAPLQAFAGRAQRLRILHLCYLYERVFMSSYPANTA